MARAGRGVAGLCKKGDVANEMFLTVSGKFLVTEFGIELPPGSPVGELGFLTPNNLRTATVEFMEAAQVLTITYESPGDEVESRRDRFGHAMLSAPVPAFRSRQRRTAADHQRRQNRQAQLVHQCRALAPLAVTTRRFRSPRPLGQFSHVNEHTCRSPAACSADNLAMEDLASPQVVAGASASP
jgi:hypothetical protein